MTRMKEPEIFIPSLQPDFSPLYDGDIIPFEGPHIGRLVIIPGLCDVHVHFREPGFSYKETIRSGSLAAAAGGYTDVFAMPNLSPVPDCRESLKLETDIISLDAVIGVRPYGAVTVGEKGEELSDMEGMAGGVIAFSDDGKGIQDDGLMEEAFIKAKGLGKIIASHCEVNDLLRGGYIHDGSYAAEHGHRGICSESEWKMIERDVALAKKTGAPYHVCHISTKESVQIIRQAKSEGVDVTCETAPHYLLLDETCLREEGRFKMNPPLRSPSDRQALIEGICDGTIDMIATDHAPHSMEEKSKGLKDSAFGIVGLETAFPLLYTYLVREGIISLDRLVSLLAVNPRRRFGLPDTGDWALWELDCEETVDPSGFMSMGRATPFERWKVMAKCLMTVYKGKKVFDREEKSEQKN